MCAARDDAKSYVACCAWIEDVKLALAGCRDCWAYKVLDAMHTLGLLEAGWRQRPLEWVMSQEWQQADIQRSLTRRFVARWQGHSHPDPRAAPSGGISMCTHMAWVLQLDPESADFSRATAPAHTKVMGPFAVLRNYYQLRIGCAHLEVQQGRVSRAPRESRLCRLCSGEDAPLAVKQAVLARTGTSQNVEDLKHFVLECPVYDDLRARCAALPASLYAQLDQPDCMLQVFEHENQTGLARTLYRMKTRRATMLGLPFTA
jgi:hypothetical protein